MCLLDSKIVLAITVGETVLKLACHKDKKSILPKSEKLSGIALTEADTPLKHCALAVWRSRLGWQEATTFYRYNRSCSP
jgi:hypothetical protein